MKRKDAKAQSTARSAISRIGFIFPAKIGFLAFDLRAFASLRLNLHE
jgi:hypothetical protein